MKRSEMVSKLIDAVFMCSQADSHLGRNEAEDLLRRIEKAGMLPPKLIKREMISIPTSDGPSTRHEIKTAYYEWEPE